MPTITEPLAPEQLLAKELVRAVRTQGLAGLGYWRAQYDVDERDPAIVRRALEKAAPVLDVPMTHTPPMAGATRGGAVVYASATADGGRPREVWRATPYAMTLAGEALCVAESLRESLRRGVTLSPSAIISQSQQEAIVRWSTAQRVLGTPITAVVRQWPAFDPEAGMAESTFERSIADHWLRHQSPHMGPSLRNPTDRLTLGLALEVDRRSPTTDFSSLVDICEPFAAHVASGAMASSRVSAVAQAVEAARDLGLTGHPADADAASPKLGL